MNLSFVDKLPFVKKIPLKRKQRRVVALIFLASFPMTLVFVFTNLILAVTAPKEFEEIVPIISEKIEFSSKVEDKKDDIKKKPIRSINSSKELDLTAYRNMAKKLLKEDKIYEAGLYLEKILSINSTDRASIISITEILIRLDELRKAQNFITPLYRKNPKDEEILSLYVSSLLVGEAETFIESSHKGFSAKVLTVAAEKLLSSSPNKSKQYLDRALKDNSKYHRAYYVFAKYFYNQINDPMFTKVEEYLKKAIRYDSDQHEYHFLLAQIYHKRGEFRKSIREYQYAVESNSGHYIYYYNMGDIYYNELNNSIEAEFMFREAIKNNSKSWKSRLQLGMIFSEKNQDADAIRLFNKALEMNPHNVRILHQLAAAYEKIGEHNKSLEVYRTILSIEPLNDIALFKIKFE